MHTVVLAELAASCYCLAASIAVSDCMICMSSVALQGNYEFGISRIIKSLEPYHSKLSTDTWFYAKRCFLSLVEGLAKHMIPFKEASWDEAVVFLEEIEKAGKSIPAVFTGAGSVSVTAGKEGQTVGQEARLLRGMFTKLRQMS